MGVLNRVVPWLLVALVWGLLGLSGCNGSRSDPVTVRSEGVEIAAFVEPAELRVGKNALWLELRDASGALLEGAAVDVRVHMHGMGTMPAMGGPTSVTELGDGRSRADFEIPMGGTWNLEIVVTPKNGSPARAEGSLTVGTRGLRLEGVGSKAISDLAATEGMAGPEAVTRHPGEFQIPVGRLQRIGVKTSTAERKMLETTVRAVGRVLAEETTLADVSLKVRGWVGEIFANTVGESVKRGEALFTAYSPELYAAQEEYIQALRSQERARESSAPDRADYLVRSARKRLRLWDIADRELDQIAETGEAIEQLPIRASVSGYVVEKNIVEGSAFQPGQRLYRIAPLSRVWIEAQVYEYELPLIREGQKASVTLPYSSDYTFEATVAYVYPTLDAVTRTARLRLELPNPDLVLRPDMYANVRVHSARGERLIVPQSAVLYAGERSFVFLALGDGRFRPQAVELGLRNGEEIEVLSGLEAGASIVSSGTFLIASESRLRAAMDLW